MTDKADKTDKTARTTSESVAIGARKPGEIKNPSLPAISNRALLAALSDWSQPQQGNGRHSRLPFRQEMIQAFSNQFLNVIVTTGERAPLGHLGAKAATNGLRLAFADSYPTKETVAHELTHVAQYEQAVSPRAFAPKRNRSRPNDSAEREARAIGTRVAAGLPAGPIRAKPSARVHLDLDDPPATTNIGTFVIDPALQQNTPPSFRTQVLLVAPGSSQQALSTRYLQLERQVLWSRRVEAFAIPVYSVYLTQEEAQAAVMTNVHRVPEGLALGDRVWTPGGPITIAGLSDAFVVTADKNSFALCAGALVLLGTDAGNVIVDMGMQLPDPAAHEPLFQELYQQTTATVQEPVGELILSPNPPTEHVGIASKIEVLSIRGTSNQYDSGAIAAVAQQQSAYRQWLADRIRADLDNGRAEWESQRPIAINQSIREQRWERHVAIAIASATGRRPPAFRLLDDDRGRPLELSSASAPQSTRAPGADPVVDLDDVEWEPVDDGDLIIIGGGRMALVPTRDLLWRIKAESTPPTRVVPELSGPTPTGPGPRPTPAVSPGWPCPQLARMACCWSGRMGVLAFWWLWRTMTIGSSSIDCA